MPKNWKSQKLQVSEIFWKNCKLLIFVFEFAISNIFNYWHFQYYPVLKLWTPWKRAEIGNNQKTHRFCLQKFRNHWNSVGVFEFRIRWKRAKIFGIYAEFQSINSTLFQGVQKIKTETEFQWFINFDENTSARFQSLQNFTGSSGC